MIRTLVLLTIALTSAVRCLNYGMWENCTRIDVHHEPLLACEHVRTYNRDFKLVIQRPFLMIEFLDQSYTNLCSDSSLPSCENYFCPYHDNLNATVDKNPNLSEEWMTKFLKRYENDTSVIIEHERALKMSYEVNYCLYCARDKFSYFHELIRSNMSVTLTDGNVTNVCAKFENYTRVIQSDQCADQGKPMVVSYGGQLPIACNCDAIGHIRANCHTFQNIVLVICYHVLPFIYVIITSAAIVLVIVFVLLPAINTPTVDTTGMTSDMKILQNSLRIRFIAKVIVGVVLVGYLFSNAFSLPFSGNVRLNTMLLSPLIGSIAYAALGVLIHSRLMTLFVSRVLKKSEYVVHALMLLIFIVFTLLLALIGAFLLQIPDRLGFFITWNLGFVNTALFMIYSIVILVRVFYNMKGGNVRILSPMPQKMSSIKKFIAVNVVVCVLFLLTWIGLFLAFTLGNALYFMMVNELNAIVVIVWTSFIGAYLYEKRVFNAMLCWKTEQQDDDLSQENPLITR